MAQFALTKFTLLETYECSLFIKIQISISVAVDPLLACTKARSEFVHSVGCAA